MTQAHVTFTLLTSLQRAWAPASLPSPHAGTGRPAKLLPRHRSLVQVQVLCTHPRNLSSVVATRRRS